MTKAQHKRQILREIADHLAGNDDWADDSMSDADHTRWSAARDELVEEWERRGREPQKGGAP